MLPKIVASIMYSESCKLEHEMGDPETIYNDLLEQVSDNGDNSKAHRLGFIFNELLKVDPMKGEKVSQKYLAECLDCTRQTISNDLT